MPNRISGSIGLIAGIALASAAVTNGVSAETGALVSVLHDSNPVSLAIFDLKQERFVELPKGTPGGLWRLGREAEDRAMCQAASEEGGRPVLWVISRRSLFRLDVARHTVERELPLPAGARGNVVDAVAWSERRGPRVALATDPAAGGSVPTVLVVDGNDGTLVATYSAPDAGMTAIYALRKDGDLFALYNQRRHAQGYAAITGLRWNPSQGFSETTSMYVPKPNGARGPAALAPVGPGRALAIAVSGRMAVLVELAGPGTAEPFPELEWGSSLVAGGGDLESLPEEHEAPVFLVDAASGGIVHRSPRHPQGELLRLDMRSSGVPPALGSQLIVSSRIGRGVVSSPDSNRLYVFDTETLQARKVVQSPGTRPTALLLLPGSISDSRTATKTEQPPTKSESR